MLFSLMEKISFIVSKTIRHAKTQEYYHNHSRTSDLAIIICYNTDTGSETDQKRVAIEELEDSNRNIKSLCRYVSATEACWRIFHYDLHDRSPAIQRLAVHLPGKEKVFYREGRAAEAIQHSKVTTLTAWFKANSEISDARLIPYHNFPEHFTWNATTCEWKPRKKGLAIGRLYQANPVEGEWFYLRLLLHHVPGSISFEDIRTLPDGTICSTFKEAALKRGLLQDDEEWIECLREASVYASPNQIRQLFVTILLFCEPAEPLNIWNKFTREMS
ncbi:uncharacterized protein [Ptychodera flava]|uniref:uncharacterized protein n=1 Tax=Ptychodera flava TaxID=63121 RepID=UPI00396A2BBE